MPEKYLNIPNALSLTRLLGVPFLFYLIHLESNIWFISWYVFLGFTDYLDGILARRWNQVTEFGSMLDSVADVAFYLSTAWFLIVLFPEYLLANLEIFYLFIAIFIFSMILSKIRLGKVLFLHTHLSRLNGVLVFFGMLASFFVDTTMLIRIILFIYIIGFIEICTIYMIQEEVDPDTRTVFWLMPGSRWYRGDKKKG